MLGLTNTSSEAVIRHIGAKVVPINGLVEVFIEGEGVEYFSEDFNEPDYVLLEEEILEECNWKLVVIRIQYNYGEAFKNWNGKDGISIYPAKHGDGTYMEGFCDIHLYSRVSRDTKDVIEDFFTDFYCLPF